MSKDRKSMDEVLASIRKIIRTDPTAAPPDITSAPGGVVGDDTARQVLEKLRRGREEDRDDGKPLSASEDPDEAARAVLEHLREQAETEARAELKRPPRSAAPKPKAEPEAEPEAAPEPELEPTPEEPPAVAADADEVPAIDEPVPAAEPEEDEALELGADAGRRVMEPHAEPEPEPELPQPAAPAERPGREAPVMVDEAALEAMIRRVVRDELMGEMGRRVTQNVVKLIRTEVAKSRIEDK